MARRPDRAFTLIELLVVIAIIGVLVGLLLPAVQAAADWVGSGTRAGGEVLSAAPAQGR